MSTKADLESRAEQEQRPGGWSNYRERAPSAMREEEPRTARTVGFFGLLLLALGMMGLLMYAYGKVSRIGPGWSSLALVLGLGGLLFHAARDRDVQVRRLYGVFGYLWLVAAAVVIALATQKAAEDVARFYLLGTGYVSLALALLFLLPFARNETEAPWHDATVRVLGAVGLLLALTGFIGSNVSALFLLPHGLLLSVLGLGYLWAFLALNGTNSDFGYRTGMAVGALGVIVFLVALGRSVLPGLFYSWGWLAVRPEPYLVPSGLLLMGEGLLYALMAAALCSDNRLIVLTRRELASFFYSPIAYIVLFGFTAVGWWQYLMFVNLIIEQPLMGGEPLVEPVISFYIISWWTVISTIFIVPVLAMRLLSEEKRTGTLEVLLTAPVDETSVVLSKFLAALIFFLVVWVPWGLFLVALRIQGGESFDYRPLLSFFIALTATGAGMMSMGLFFSALTRNQIAAAILTFAGMITWTLVFFLKRDLAAESAGRTLMTYVSYVDLWIDSVQGTLSPRFLIFHISAAIFWLFLTVKVMEARRWS